MRDIPIRLTGAILGAAKLAMAPSDKLVSAFAVAGMDFGIPPVVRAMAKSGRLALRDPDRKVRM